MKFLKEHFSFEEIKSLFQEGVYVQEKIDGFHGKIQIRAGEVYLARNKQEMEQGGLGLHEVLDKEWEGGQKVAEGFYDLCAKLQEQTPESFSTKDFEDVEFVSDICKNLYEYNEEGIFLHDTQSKLKPFSITKNIPVYYIQMDDDEIDSFDKLAREIIPNSDIVKEALHPKLNQMCEGIIVEYKGDRYKVTGEYGIVNQKDVIYFPGSFKPPHKGHVDTIKEHDAIPVISSKPKNGMTAQKSKEILEQCGISPVVVADDEKSPVRASHKLIERFSGTTRAVILKGQKDASEARSDGQEIISEEKGWGISSTRMMQFVDNNQKDLFKTFMPDELSDQYKEKIFDSLISKPYSGINDPELIEDFPGVEDLSDSQKEQWLAVFEDIINEDESNIAEAASSAFAAV